MQPIKQRLSHTAMALAITACALFSQAASALETGSTLEPAKIEAALQAAYDKYKGLEEGANAYYIPVLAAVDSNIFGITLVTTDGKVYSVGDIDSVVSIQSISKVFTMARVMDE